MAKIANFGKKCPKIVIFTRKQRLYTNSLRRTRGRLFVDLALKIECWSSRRGKRHSPSIESEAAPQGLAEYHVFMDIKF